MNAYRSVRSAVGSFAIRGASRWLDAFAFLAAFGVSAAAPIANAAIPVSAAAVTAFLRMVLASSFDDRDRSICGHIRSGAEFGSVGGDSSHFANRSQDGAYAWVRGADSHGAGGGRRADDRRRRGALSRARRLPGAGRARRRAGRRDGGARAARPGGARRDAAAPRRAPGDGDAAAAAADAGDPADRPRRRAGAGQRAAPRRRRLRGEAVLARRAGGAGGRGAAAAGRRRRRRRGGRAARVRRRRDRRGGPRLHRPRASGRADREGVRAAPAPGAQPGSGVLPRRPDGRGVAVSVLLEHRHRHRPRPPAAPQDRGGPAAPAAPPDGLGRRLQARAVMRARSLVVSLVAVVLAALPTAVLLQAMDHPQDEIAALLAVLVAIAVAWLALTHVATRRDVAGSLRRQYAAGVLGAVGLVLVSVLAGTALMVVSRRDAELVAVMLLFSLIVALRVASLLSGHAAGQITRLGEGLRRLAAGRGAEPLPETGPRELQELAIAANAMARDLNASDRARRELVAAVSHDLRTPIAS